MPLPKQSEMSCTHLFDGLHKYILSSLTLANYPYIPSIRFLYTFKAHYKSGIPAQPCLRISYSSQALFGSGIFLFQSPSVKQKTGNIGESKYLTYIFQN